jgi:hypothetical protein
MTQAMKNISAMGTFMLAVLCVSTATAQKKPNLSPMFAKTAMKALLTIQTNNTGNGANDVRMKDAIENTQVEASNDKEKEVMVRLAGLQLRA